MKFEYFQFMRVLSRLLLAHSSLAFLYLYPIGFFLSEYVQLIVP